MTLEETERNELFGFDVAAVKKAGYDHAKSGGYKSENPHRRGSDQALIWDQGFILRLFEVTTN